MRMGRQRNLLIVPTIHQHQYIPLQTCADAPSSMENAVGSQFYRSVSYALHREGCLAFV